MSKQDSRADVIATITEIRRLQAHLGEVWDDEQARMDTWAAIQGAMAQFEAADRDLTGRSESMDEEQAAGAGSFVEARMLASGQVTYVVRAAPGTTIDEMREAVEIAQQTLLYATTEDDEDDDSGGDDDGPDESDDDQPPRRGRMVRIAT